MKFSKKIFLAIFGTGVFSALAICLILNTVLSKHRLHEFEDSYIDHMNLMAKTLGLLEADQTRPALNNLLTEMIHHDADNLSVELVGPEGESLGKVQQEGFTDRIDIKEVFGKPDGAFWYKGDLIVLTSLKDQSGVQYRLVTTISSATIDKEIQNIQMTLLVTAAILIILSLWLSSVLAKTLLRKVDSIYSTLDEITNTQDYSKRVRVVADSKDELDGLGENLNRMLETLQSNQNQLLEAERDKARSQVAAQVAHDIRSPLMSMNMALAQIETAQLEPLAILKSAVARVAGIVQKLTASSSINKESESSVETPKLTLIEPLIASVVSEQNVRRSSSETLVFTGFSSQPQIWSVVQVNELQSALSNLINNAFEAGANRVELKLATVAKEWTLAIKDNGKGIPTDILGRIFERSFTHGKKTGSGLGLFQAKAAIEWSGGTLEVSTTEGQGTTFTLKMPKEKNPAWLPQNIELSLDQPILFVDDDSNVLKAWKDKTTALGLTKASFFNSIEDLEKSQAFKNITDQTLLVIDQNLSDRKKGLDLIAELGIGKRAYLCTSDFDEQWIQDKIRGLNAHLIPKPWISLFELKVRTS